MAGAKSKKDTPAEGSFPPDPRGKIQASYSVYWNKPTKHLMILQFPNRERNQPYNKTSAQKPLEMRIKPKCGLVEVDIPLNTDESFDRHKAIQYGNALKRSKLVQQGGSYGMAGGLGVGGLPRFVRSEGRAGREEPSEEAMIANFEESNRQGRVLNKMTLGGKIRQSKDGQPMYAIGVFRRDELHLTRVDSFCMLQPQYHHLDALNDNEKLLNRAQRDIENPAPESEARTVNMAVKSTDDDELDMSDMARTLRAMQEERWQRLDWLDEADDQAYKIYHSQLFMADSLKDQSLVSAMTKLQYLDWLSAPRVDPTNQGKKVTLNRWHSDEEDSDAASVVVEAENLAEAEQIQT